VSRGGVKLARAGRLRHPVRGRLALDIGASTGGFTDVLLKAGASRVVALDVGHGQIDWTLRNDARVVVVERVNARSLTPDMLPAGLRAFDIVTIDVSFISLRLILPVVPPLIGPGADVVALVKPQFEAGRREVGKGGLVRDERVHARVVAEIVDAADRVGLAKVADTASPLPGMEGNREYFLHLRRPGARVTPSRGQSCHTVNRPPPSRVSASSRARA
jgi:23S rRNA (cytidine1920-2'-O)/16S rRNA (cytidine1409-2'-O)-methyltransferase